VTFKEFQKLIRVRRELAEQSAALWAESERAEEEVAAAIKRATEVRNRARLMQKRLNAAANVEDEAFAREAAGIEETAAMEEASRDAEASPPSASASSVVDVASWGFDQSDLSAFPSDWLAAGAIFPEFEMLAGGFGGGTPPVEAGNSSSS
jgi:hypothetical protein